MASTSLSMAKSGTICDRQVNGGRQMTTASAFRPLSPEESS